jgi:hypothetical protein
LYQPGIQRHGRYILSSAVGSRVSELVCYYRDVRRLMEKRQKIVGDDMYYWLRPMVFAEGVPDLAFPWHDCWRDIYALLSDLTSSGDGMLFRDKNEGWAFQVFGEGDRLFLWQSRLQSGVEDLAIATGRADVRRQVPEVRARMEPLLRELTEGVGADHWTKR